MGLFGIVGDIFGGGGKSNEKSTTQSSSGTTKKTQDQTASKTETSTAEKAGTQTGLTTTSNLSPEVIALLTAALGDQAANIDDVATGDAARQSQDFAGILAERAQGTSEFIDAASQGILTDARRSGERALGGEVTAAQRAAGGGRNSLVALKEAEGRAALESKLGGLEGELTIAGRQLESADLAAAMEAINSSVGVGVQAGSSNIANLAALSQILKGAEVSGTSELASQETASSETLTDIINKLIESGEFESSGSGTVSGGESSSGGIFDIFKGAAGIAGGAKGIASFFSG